MQASEWTGVGSMPGNTVPRALRSPRPQSSRTGRSERSGSNDPAGCRPGRACSQRPARPARTRTCRPTSRWSTSEGRSSGMPRRYATCSILGDSGRSTRLPVQAPAHTQTTSVSRQRPRIVDLPPGVDVEPLGQRLQRAVGQDRPRLAGAQHVRREARLGKQALGLVRRQPFERLAAALQRGCVKVEALAVSRPGRSPAAGPGRGAATPRSRAGPAARSRRAGSWCGRSASARATRRGGCRPRAARRR